nr:hypothetical protein [Pseudomonas benzenivorans]
MSPPDNPTPRSVELKQRAVSEANELTFLSRQTEAKRKAIEARLGRVQTLDPYRHDPTLACQRAKAYSGARDLCPRCAVWNDVQTTLVVDATSTDFEFVTCPACSFHALLPK